MSIAAMNFLIYYSEFTTNHSNECNCKLVKHEHQKRWTKEYEIPSLNFAFECNYRTCYSQTRMNTGKRKDRQQKSTVFSMVGVKL